jgi:MFS family permease
VRTAIATLKLTDRHDSVAYRAHPREQLFGLSVFDLSLVSRLSPPPVPADTLHSSAIALALEIVIWFTHSLVGNGICFSFVGFFLGPVYPIALMVISEVLDDDLRGGVMALMGSMGGAGAAAVPL